MDANPASGLVDRLTEGRLPRIQSLGTLATKCVFIGHAQRADVFWTRSQFLSLCEHLHNDNPENEFLLTFPRPNGDPREPYAKSKGQRMERRAEWAWDTLVGKAKSPAGIGFYATNSSSESRWGAFDFDAHDGEAARARAFALAAFETLLRQEDDLFLVLCTSGGNGWHLFVLSADFHPVEEWHRLLKEVAIVIGAPAKKGICELFPNGGKGRGNAIRAPGTWHPKTNDFSRIAHETIRPLLQSRVARREIVPFLIGQPHEGKIHPSSLIKREKKFKEIVAQFAIIQPSTRHDQLASLISKLYRIHSRAVTESIARRQFEVKTVETRADFREHLADFVSLWECWLSRYTAALSDKEKFKVALLNTDREREAFRIAWGFANIDREKDFAYSTEHFSWNLGVTIQAACKQRNKLVDLRIIELTKPFVPNRSSARYRWIAPL